MSKHEASVTGFTFGNQFYDVLKFIAQVVLPALATLYFTLAQILNLPAAEQVVGTIAAVDTFLGVLLGITANTYKNSDASKDGALVVDSSDPMKDKYLFEVTTPLDDLKNRKSITLKIKKPLDVQEIDK